MIQVLHKPLDSHVAFFETDRRTLRETVSFTAGHCVGYEEDFEAGDQTAGAYVCHLTIAAEKLTFSAGGPPGAFVAPAPREHGSPPLGFTGAPLPGPTAGEVATALAPELLPLAPLLLPAAARTATRSS